MPSDNSNNDRYDAVVLEQPSGDEWPASIRLREVFGDDERYAGMRRAATGRSATISQRGAMM